MQGHIQHIDIAIHRKTQAFALFSGICYQHDEDYLGAQGNSQKPGIWMLNEVDGTGNADLLQISLDYLRRRYGWFGRCSSRRSRPSIRARLRRSTPHATLMQYSVYAVAHGW